MTDFRALGEEVVYEGWAITVAKAQFEAPDGSTFERDVIHHPGAVAALPMLDASTGVFVRQFRSALNTRMLEIPAGIRDVPGEPLEETARRELVEEVGLSAGSLELLARVHNAVGYCDEEIVIYLATDLADVERQLTDSPEEHDMEIVHLALEEVEAMIARGEVTDMKTIVAVLAALRRRE